MKAIRTVVGYTALAIGVTVGGVAIGATVVAPIVAPSTAPARSVNVLHLTKDFVNAMPSFDRIPSTVWLFVAGAAALVLLAALGWKLRNRVRSRIVPTAQMPLDLSSLPAAAMPATVVGGKNRTPRAVQALAEAGTTPADIARRTGLPLDAVVLCLAMSPIGARQLRPPTA
ncbi:MAG: hypothetical protein ABJC26_07565 [Gemmatimonadaceae bacterium]